jgi:uncharacterized protein YkwD
VGLGGCSEFLGMPRKARRLLATAASLAALCAVFTGPGTTPAAAKAKTCTGTTLHASQLPPEDYGDAILCLLNRERAAEGLKPVRYNAQLSAAALPFTVAMREQSFFDHTAPDGSTPTTRIRATGYLKNARRWMLGENIAWGESYKGTPAAIMAAWMASPGHRENILTARFREIGIGVAYGSPEDAGLPDTAIVTTDFGGVDRFGRAGRAGRVGR